MRDQERKFSLLESKLRGRCLRNEPMSRHTSFRIGGPADLLYAPADEEDLRLALGIWSGRPYTRIGNGTNLLISERGIRGLTIWIGRGLGRMECRGRMVVVGAGSSLPYLVRRCQQWGLSGLEWAAGIPGSLGGALVMNAGAYGGQMADVVDRVFGLMPSGRRLELKPSQIGFSYRHAEYPHGFIITGCRLRLKPGDPSRIRKRMEEWLGARRRNQPLSLPSAGCIFRNPEGDSARRLIGVAGLRGRRCGRARISAKHANFIVNYGGARASDVLKLMEIAVAEVKRCCGVTLVPEVKLIGEW